MVDHSPKPIKQARFTPANCLLYVLGLVLAAQPVANDDLWWLVAHGQKALQGFLQPSSELIAVETSESAWMAGIPVAVTYDLLGSDGLMLLKMLATAWLCCLVAREARNSGPAATLVSAVGLVAMIAAFEPGRVLWDALGVLVAWHILQADPHRTRRNSLLFAVLVVVWANCSHGVVWVLPLIVVQSLLLRFTVAKSFGLLAASLICLSLTPRGIYTLADAGMVTLPIHLPLDMRAGTPWQSIWQQAVSVRVASSLVAYAVLMALCVRRRSGRVILLLLLAVPAICCSQNLPITSLLVTLSSLKLMENKEATKRISFMQFAVTGAVVVCVCAAVASGWKSESGERLGWGIATSLDYRFVQRDLQQKRRLDGAAHCPDIRTAGMLAFTASDGFRPSTTPTIAILTGQFIEYSRLTQELLQSRKSSFRRSDGTQGGWWRTVEDQSVAMLMVPADNAALIRSLEPTLWKPLSLDSPVIPYVRTDHRRWTSQLTQMVQQRELVNHGNWQHAPNWTTANLLHTDLWQLLTGAADYRRDLQQAEAFRAMGQATAAMRVLLPVLSDSSESVRQLFHQTQIALALEEWKHSGVVSLLRQATIRQSAGEQTSLSRLRWLPEASADIKSHWKSAVDAYMNGEIKAATEQFLSSASKSDEESIYAAVTLSKEGDDAALYQRLFSQMQAEFSDSPWLSFVEMNQP